MAVSDPQNFLNLKFSTPEKKYIDLRQMFYLDGKANLKGNLAVRVIDSLLLRSFGLLIGFGKKASDPESEYKRLTGNFKRMGKMAKLMGRLGPLGCWLLRLTNRAYADLIVRQKIYGVEKRTNHVEAAKDYFKILDLFDFKVEVCSSDDSKVEIKFSECPLGYVQGDDIRVCKASMEFDYQCISRLGAKSILKEEIPSGAHGCLIHIVPAES